VNMIRCCGNSNFRKSLRVLMCSGVGLAMIGGCSRGSSRVNPPRLNPSRSATEALKLYDSDGDGEISPTEANASPGLTEAFVRIDTDSNGRLAESEIESRIRAWRRGGLGITLQPFYVFLDGRPLKGGRVELIPDTFIARGLRGADGEISANGLCSPSLSETDLPPGVKAGIYHGFYTIKVTHPKAVVPASYDGESTLGIEVRPDYDFFNPLKFDLKSTR
jgi:hypothetical protein